MSTPPRQRGLSLVELMIGMLIGLFLIGGMVQLLGANRQVYRYQEALSRIQEHARFALETLGYEIRMAGYTGCPIRNEIANVINGAGTTWWLDFNTGSVRGYDGSQHFPGRAIGTNTGDRVAGTDAATFIHGGGDSYTVATHNPTAAEFKLNTTHDLDDGSIVLVCDATQTSILQLTNVNSSNVTIVHNTGTATPGNCTKGLGSPVECTANGTPYTFGPDSSMVDFVPTAFYIGVSTSGTGRSLYRIRSQVSAATTSVAVEELIEGVEDMQIFYGIDADGDRVVDPDYVDASAITDWEQVLSVRLELLFVSLEDQLNIEPQWIAFPSADTGRANLIGDGFTAADRRLYQAFGTTLGLRNRLP
ncbi:PilW family protein [Marichromatium bheemlicum]|uniref:Pilus assembly protein PilW n=1 Tax=Marichromatium bheemlicum TaxID=365339 RepID=A0ABX1I7X1_9GAMM|nr:PilW family protein [Marichromatium bheemlicum]NKN33654.1 pilus assembly protein PilW [Marichromatium bheemlicum]